MASRTAFFADDGGDPRLNSAQGREADYVRPDNRKLHDPNVTFEEYFYYAKLARAEESSRDANDEVAGNTVGIWQTIFPSKSDRSIPKSGSISSTEKKSPSSPLRVTDEEWKDASRALRTATWGACFYLITTDVLGPYGLPYAFGTTGFGPGAALYTVFGALAYYSGYMIWQMFLGLDSYQFPMRTYGDLAYRIYGSYARHCLNLLQSIQLLCNVGVIIIGNGQSLSQIVKFRLCFAVCCLVWAIAGCFIGQVRTLQKYGWIANCSIWLNLFVIFMTMGVVARSPPNYAGAQSTSAGVAVYGPGAPQVVQRPDGSYPPVIHSGGLPDAGNFNGAVNGLMQAVYAYGGAMVFCEFMAEMKRPNDFIKSITCASAFIYCFYMLFGLFVYGYQGQYTVNPVIQGISPYAWQTAGNVIALVATLIAAGLYGNIGIKVLYNNILIEWFSFPTLEKKNGKLLWAVIVPIYWSLAYVVAAAIPNFSGLTGVVAALCIMQFTYTFPPMLYIGFLSKKNAMREGEGFDPTTGQTVRHDGGLKRFARGFMADRWYLNSWNVVYALGALATAGLGAYASIETLIAAFSESGITAFTCHSPLDG